MPRISLGAKVSNMDSTYPKYSTKSFKLSNTIARHIRNLIRNCLVNESGTNGGLCNRKEKEDQKTLDIVLLNS
jgi:hypothetical protein